MAMQDRKTTMIALVTGVFGVASQLGFVIPQEYFEIIITLGVLALGIAARDGKAVRPD